MGKAIKAGRVVVILAGKYAGKKAVIVNINEEGTEKYKFPHAVVIGVEKAPRRVTRAMSEKKVQKKTHAKVFTKVINLQHFMPTRYNVDYKLESVTGNPKEKKAALKEYAKVFQESYIKQGELASEKTKTGVAYLFKKLYF